MKAEMPKHIQEYKEFKELGIEAQKKALRKWKLFNSANGFQNKKEDIEKNLFKENGDLACITKQERENLYTVEKSSEILNQKEKEFVIMSRSQQAEISEYMNEKEIIKYWKKHIQKTTLLFDSYIQDCSGVGYGFSQDEKSLIKHEE